MSFDPRIPASILFTVLEEVESEIKLNGISLQEKAGLFHQLGSIYGLLGDEIKQKNAWQQAQNLAPNNEMIRASLKSLEN